MKSLLHIVTRPEDPLARRVIEQQQRQGDDAHPVAVRVVDLSQGQPDYGQLVEAVFAADSIQVW